jgi:E3 ubiquitin-protein ligase RFWD2
MAVKELDSLMTLIAEKKRHMEQQESETNMQILLVFLHCLRKQKLEELNEVCLYVFFSMQVFFLATYNNK